MDRSGNSATWKTGELAAVGVAGLLFGQALSAQQVTLPLARYDELRGLASPGAAEAPAPAQPVAFERATLNVTVGETSARIAQDLTLAVYGDGWRNLPVANAGTYIDAAFGSAEGRLADDAITLRGTGRHDLRLASVVPVTFDETATRPTWRLQLQAPAAAVVRGVVEAPPGVDEVRAEGALLEPAAGGGWSFVAEPGSEMAFTLFGKATVPERDSLPLRYQAVSAVSLEVSRSRQRARAWLEGQVLQGRLERWIVPLPAGFEVIDVDGEAIAGWALDAGRLVVTPRAAVSDRFALEVELSGGGTTELVSPVLRPEGAASMLVASKVHTTGDGLLELLTAGSGRAPEPQQAADFPAAFRLAPGMPLVMSAEGPAPRWQVSWSEGTEVLATQVDRLLIDVLVGDSGRAAYQLWAEVRNRGVMELTVGLPAATELIAARRDGRRIQPGRSGDAWVLPLNATASRQVIHLSGLVPLAMPDGSGHLDLPLPRLSAPASRIEARVLLPGERRYVLDDALRRGAVQPPAEPSASAAPSALAQWLGGVAVQGPAVGGADFLPRPPGFEVIEAAWSALSKAPEPLRLRIVDDAEKRGWF